MNKNKRFFFIFSLFFLSCSTHEPLVSNVFTRYGYSYNPLDSHVKKTASIFFNITDEDGLGDIETISIKGSYDYAKWVLDKENWIIVKSDDNNGFVGSNDLILYDGFDGGSYQVQVSDYAAKKYNFSISLKNLDDLKDDDFPKPVIDIQKNTFFISNYDDLKKRNLSIDILVFKGKKLILNSPDVNSIEINSEKEDRIYIYLYDNTTKIYYKSGPYMIPVLNMK